MRKLSVAIIMICALGLVTAGASAAVQELMFMHYLGAWDGTVMEEMINEFNASHPDIQVQNGFAKGMVDKLLVSVAGGAPPDIALSTPENIPTFVQAGAAGPLEVSRFAKLTVGTDMYVPEAWRGAHYEGTMYGIPMGMGALGLYINPDKFEQVGLNAVPPKNRAEMDQAEKLLQQDTDGDGVLDQVGLEMPFRADLNHLWYSVLKQFGGDVFRDGKVVFGGEQGIKATEELTDFIVSNGLFIRPTLSMFQGKSAMRINGTWMKHGIEGANIPYMTGPVPQFGPQPAAWSGAQYLIVPPQNASEEKKAAIYTFVEWMASHTKDWALRSGHLPSRWDAIRDPEFYASMHHRGFVEEAGYLNFYPVEAEWTQARPMLVDMINNSVAQTDAPRVLLQQAVQQVEGLFTK